MESRHLLKSSVLGKVILLIALCLPGLVSLGQQKEYLIDGNINAVKDAVVYLVNAKDLMVLDSSDVNAGKFQFKGLISSTTPMILALNERQTGYKESRDSKYLFIEAGTIKVNGINNLKDAAVSGTMTNDDANTLKNSTRTDSIDAALAKLVKTSSADQQKTEQYRKRLTILNDLRMDKYKSVYAHFIKSHTTSLISLRALAELSDVEEFDILNPLYNGLSGDLKHSEEGKRLAEQLQVLQKVALGSVIPDIILPDTNGKMVSLASFRGKYLLVDVWASWCPPCRVENPNLVAAYNTYKMKNFGVVGISLDSDKDKAKWRQAIEKDGLEWTQLSDLKVWESEAVKALGINSIPQNYLLDPNGVIISKNLTGENLNVRLKEIFDSK